MRKLLPIWFLFFLACASPHIAEYKSESTTVTKDAGDGGLDSLIEPYRDAMKAEMNEEIGEALVTLEKYTPESPLGNFAAEAVYLEGLDFGNNTRAFGPNIMKSSFSLLNFGGLRSSIEAGVITVGDIYELMPFDNTLTLVKVSGEKMRKCAQYLFNQGGQPIYNAQFQLSNDLQKVSIGGEAYNFDEEVVIITSNYLADGGDKMEFFSEPLRKYDTGIFIRDIFIDFVKSQKILGKYEETGKFDFIKN